MLSKTQLQTMNAIVAEQKGGLGFTAYKCVEEMAELQKEIIKQFNTGKNRREKIIEEMGDVLFNIYYLRHALDIPMDEIAERIDFRYKRMCDKK